MPVQHAVWLTTESLIGIASCILTWGRYSHYALTVQFFNCLLRFFQIHHNSLIGHTLICLYRDKKEWIFQSLRLQPNERQSGCRLKALWKFEADLICVKWSTPSPGSSLWLNNKRIGSNLWPTKQVPCIVSCKKWLDLILYISNSYYNEIVRAGSDTTLEFFHDL